MRFLRGFITFAILVAAASAAELKIKVVDPQSAAVAGAQVELLNHSTAIAVETTSAEGLAVFTLFPEGATTIRVVAPGFGVRSLDFPASTSETLTVRLRLATTSQTVVVTATRSAVPVEDTAASVASVSGKQLEVMNPVGLNDALRFLPSAIVNTAGQHGGQASLFVRGGDSRYNKVIVDDVPVNDPGGTFDFGVVPLQEIERLEFLRGAQSTLYGSDALSSVVQVWSRNGNTAVPELRFGADGGNLGTAHGYASLAGARGRFDYNIFGDQFNTSGQGINDEYSNSEEGANLGVALSSRLSVRLRGRHFNTFSGVQNEWKFNGNKLFEPDSDQRARQNNLLGSLQVAFQQSPQWDHKLTVFDYNTKRLNIDDVADRGCDVVNFNFFDCFFSATARVNRLGFQYQGNYTPVTWAQSTFGYDFEVENGNFDSQFLTLDFNTNQPFIGGGQTHGLRRNHGLFLQQRITWNRASVVGGFRYVHNESFGNRVVPRVAGSFLAWRGGNFFSGTRFNFSYAEGIKEPRFEETFGISGTFPSNPNPDLKPEENKTWDAGFTQNFLTGKYALSAVYYHNSFRNQIQFGTDPITFLGQYFNLNRSLAHGAEVEFNGRPLSSLGFTASYTYTSTQILEAPLCTPANFCDPLFGAGAPLLRRPQHSATLLLTHLGTRWGANLGGSFVGRRADSDFLGLGFTHSPGYFRADTGGWYAWNSRITSYVNVENPFNHYYEEVLGYPALGINFRAGLRFRIGGE